MNRLKLLSVLNLCTIYAYAQIDITTTYMANASFEADDISTLSADNDRKAYVITNIAGWTLSGAPTGSYGVSDIMTAESIKTDDNFGAPGTASDGTQMYYVRYAWNKSTTTLQQSITLPPGKYRIAVDNKLTSAATNHSASLFAGNDNIALTIKSSTSKTWSTTNLDFETSAEGPIAIGVRVNFQNAKGLSVLLDNFRIYDMANYVEPEAPTESAVDSYTEGVITSAFVPESEMKSDLLKMLAEFTTYMKNDWTETSTNSEDSPCGYFNGENSGASDERGVRPNADLSMICAFLSTYAKPANVTLPSGITWEKIDEMAMKSLVYAYSTHKANQLKTCKDGKYWGSTSKTDFMWESSLWAMSVAYSAYFQWDKLSDKQKEHIYKMLKAECNYEIERDVPTGYQGDTKAEENGWEADILAATLGLFPNDALAEQWFDRLRLFAINSYSHANDAFDNTIIDPNYDTKTVADYYKGANLYYDYSLQNHNLFHTSYQNVVMQELGEAALALKLFQNGLYGTEKWHTNALMHNNQEVQDNILNWLALADGELAMPNGNDWSLFLYDQITSYSTQACFQKDANALMLENLAYKYIRARQQTTNDGSWLLRADVGARRMGVEAHRVMMTYLMHEANSTADMTPTSWNDFNTKFSEAKILPCQNIVRAASDYRFTCFSWSTGLKSYTGYFASNSADKNKIVVPYRANNTGNIIGWYDVSGASANATPVVSGIYQLDGNSYVMNGEMNVNDSKLNKRFAIYSTPSNAIIYIDHVKANSTTTITSDKTGLLAISTDELMKEVRTLYYADGDDIAHKQTDGTTFQKLNSNWVNIDNEIGVIGKKGKVMGFGDRDANNSIYTSKLYPTYSNTSTVVNKGEMADAHNIVYYSLVDAEQTKKYAEALVEIRDLLPTGWNGVIAPDKDMNYMLISNFAGVDTAKVQGIATNGMAPVFYSNTTIVNSTSSATFIARPNHSIAQPLTVLVKGTNVEAQLIDATSAYITATADTKIDLSIAIVGEATPVTKEEVEIAKDATVKVYLSGKEIVVEKAEIPTIAMDDYSGYIVNPDYDGSSALGWSGAPVSNYDCAEKFDTKFDIYQVVTGLPSGKYAITCQGFYRNGLETPAATARANGTEQLNAILYANDAQTPLKSIFESANKCNGLGVATSQGYIPNNMNEASMYFAEGEYLNSLTCKVGKDGTLRIGIRKDVAVSKDWTIFDTFTLTYLGENDEEEPEQPEESGNGIVYVQTPSSQCGIFGLNGVRMDNVKGLRGIYVIDGKLRRVK